MILNLFYAILFFKYLIPEEEFRDDESSRDLGRETDQQVDNPASHFHQFLKNLQKKRHERTNIEQKLR